MAATTTTVCAGIDFLVDLIPTLPGCTPADGVDVFDGFIGVRVGPTFVLVGDENDPVVTDDQTFAATGYARDEDYTVALMIGTGVGGTDQRSARQTALGVLEAIDKAIVADPSLGGLINKSANVDRISLQQTTKDTSTSGRQAVFSAAVHVRNRIQRAAS